MTTIICEGAHLAKALGAVRSIAKKTDIMPILGHVLIETEPTALRVTSTNLDIRLARVIVAQCSAATSFTVEAQRFADVVGALAAGVQIELTHTDNSLHMKAGRGKFRFGALESKGFPTLDFGEPMASISTGKRFLESLANVQHAMEPEGSVAYNMAGAFLTNNDGIELVATDGKRMSIQRPDMIADIPSIIIANAAVAQMLKLADGFQLDIREDRIRCIFDDGELVAKTIDGTFPTNYRTIIPTNIVHSVAFDPDAMLSALARISLLSDDSERTVSLEIDADRIIIRNRTQGIRDEGAEEIPCELTGDPVTVRYRATQLRDTLKTIDADSVKLEMQGPLGPGKITSASRPEMILVLMPMSS